jgi:Flp pilus assembly protein TadB
VTTEVSNFCCFALFAQAPVTPAATTKAQPVPSPTQGTGTFILSGLILWGVTQVKQHPLVIPAIVIIAVGIILYGMKRRGDRKKRQRERLMGHS